jgi:hypothetical protein
MARQAATNDDNSTKAGYIKIIFHFQTLQSSFQFFVIQERKVFFSNAAIVIGPTPPGTGVI